MILWSLLSMAWAAEPSPWERVQALRVRSVDALRDPSPAERAALTALARDLTLAAPTGKVPDALVARARGLGATLEVGERTAVLGREGGWGVLALRMGAADPIVFQAPHPWFDLGTGALVDQLFDGGGARAAVFATVHRRLADGTDAAHQPEGGFQALTLGVVEALAEPLVVQIHGFGDGHTGAEVVVGGWGADALARALHHELGWIATDGTAVPSLAGRSNVQVRALAGAATLAHLELSKPLRERLRDDARLRTKLYGVLQRWSP